MYEPYWPLERLRIVAPLIELRHPTPEDLSVLAREAAGEAYNPSVPMLASRDDDPVERGRRTLQWYWQQWASWRPEHWSLLLSVHHEGLLVGTVNLRARNFAQLREVETGSWIFPDRQRSGLGTAARRAVLDFAFDGLGAQYARSAGAEDNAASLRVSEKLGYERDGGERLLMGGDVVPAVRLILSAARWRGGRRAGACTVEGLTECLPLFGLD